MLILENDLQAVTTGTYGVAIEEKRYFNSIAQAIFNSIVSLTVTVAEDDTEDGTEYLVEAQLSPITGALDIVVFSATLDEGGKPEQILTLYTMEYSGRNGELEDGILVSSSFETPDETSELLEALNEQLLEPMYAGLSKFFEQ